MSKKKNLNVLSLFDGIGCSRLALNKCNNIKVNKYFYSEIDKNCIKLTEKKFPNDIQILKPKKSLKFYNCKISNIILF